MKKKRLLGFLISLVMAMGLMLAMSVTAWATPSTVATKITSQDLTTYTGYEELPGWTALNMDESDTVSDLPKTGEVWLVYAKDSVTMYKNGVKQSSFGLSWDSLPYQINTMGKQVYYPKLAHTHGDITFQPWTDALAEEQNGSGKTAANSLPGKAGNYYLMDDVQISGGDSSGNAKWNVPEGTVNLCLNGQSITASDTNKRFTYFKVSKNAELNLYDEDGDQGTISGGDVRTGNGIITVSEGSFNMYGGTITGCKALTAIVENYNGTFTMNGGAINDNEVNNNNGGAVALYGNSATFTMNGGTIAGNQVKSTYSGISGPDGGGVYVKQGAAFTMNGGAITGNKVCKQGGGVYVDKGCTFNLSGNATIKGNLSGCTFNNGVYEDESGTSGNVYLTGSEKINITGELANDDPIGVSMETLSGGVFTRSSGEVKASEFKSKFAADNENFVVKTEGDELKLAHENSISYLGPDGEMKETDTYATLDEVKPSNYEYEMGGGWYLADKNYEFDKPIIVKGTVNLILSDGATLNAAKGFVVDKETSSSSYSSVLNIFAQSTGDTAGKLIASGYISGYNYPAIGTTRAAGGTLNIYGGNITATGATSAAAIGGGRNSSYSAGYPGITVGIYGGTLEATAGEGAAAIGAGKDSDDHGIVSLGKDISVFAGADKDNVTDVTATFEKTHNQAYVKTQVKEREPADDVIDMIKALPVDKDVTTKDKAAIEAARKAFDDLDADQKAKVPKRTQTKLQNVENRLAVLEYADAAKTELDNLLNSKKQADYDEADWTALTNAIKDGKDAIDEAVTKKEVDTALKDAEANVDGIKTKAQKKADADKAAADAVTALIKAIPDDPTSDEGIDAIAAARAAYDALNDDQKKLVENIVYKGLLNAELTAGKKLLVDAVDAVMANAEGKILESQADMAKTAAMNAKIAVLTATTTADAITATTNFSAYLDVLKGNKTAAVEKAAGVDALIAAIPENPSISDSDKIFAAREAYDNLTDEEKTLMAAGSIEKLEAAELAYAKAIAKSDLENTRNSIDDSLYDSAGIAELDQAKADGDAAIEAADNVEDVIKAGVDAMVIINTVLTKADKEARTLDEAKEAANAKLDSMINGRNKADYDASDWAALTKAVEDGKAAVDKATTTAAVASATDSAIKAVSAVKTKALKSAEEKAKAAKKAAKKAKFKPLGKVKITKAKGAKKKIKLKWKKVKKAKGYEIVIANNKKFKDGALTYTAKKTKKVIKKLKKGKYFVKIRAYKKVKGNTVYGKFSKVKRVKVR